MKDKGIAHIGIGKAKGDDKALEAVKQAVASPLLDTSIEGASDVIINVSGDISLIEANEAASYVEELAGENANIIFGAIYDEKAQDECTITVIATGITEVAQHDNKKQHRQASGLGGFSNQQRPGSQGQGGYRRPQEGPSLDFGFGRSANQGVSNAQPAQEQPQQFDNQMPFRPQVNKEVTINIPDFLKNRK